MPPPKIYIETTIPSYLTGRPSRDLLIAGHQQVTHQWWDDRRDDFELYVSQLVEDECRAGDVSMAEKRLDIIRGIPLLEISSDVDRLADQLITIGPIPTKAETDAAHIAVAAIHRVDYLLTWNCKHIANAEMQKSIREICRKAGFEPPIICTPEELLGE